MDPVILYCGAPESEMKRGFTDGMDLLIKGITYLNGQNIDVMVHSASSIEEAKEFLQSGLPIDVIIAAHLMAETPQNGDIRIEAAHYLREEARNLGMKPSIMMFNTPGYQHTLLHDITSIRDTYIAAGKVSTEFCNWLYETIIQDKKEIE